jgi:hypothetical protein
MLTWWSGRDRTDDLKLAKLPLSQLSYAPGPNLCMSATATFEHCLPLVTTKTHHFESMVGLGRLELPTSRLSGVRSNHLSYRPPLYGGKGWRSRVRPSRKRNEGGGHPA